MLINPLKDKLTALKLTGMLEALEEQIRMPDLVRDLSFEDRMGLSWSIARSPSRKASRPDGA